MQAVLSNPRICYQTNRWANRHNGLHPRIRHIEIGNRIDKGALQNPTKILIRIIAIGAALSKQVTVSTNTSQLERSNPTP